MCDLLGSLKGKLEPIGSCGFPGVDSLCTRHPVKGVVDFNAVQLSGVELKKLFFRKAFRIELWPPFFITEAGRTEPNCRHSGIIAHAVQKNGVNIGLHACCTENLLETGRISQFSARFSTVA